MIKKIKNKALKEKICDTLANKIVKCPNCGEEIDYLVSPVSYFQEFSLNSRGRACYEDGEEDVVDPPSYLCPGCHNEICSDEGDAIAFLKGKEEDEE